MSGPKDSCKGKSCHLEISALSRPLDLGTLYDARNDRLIPGSSLWKAKDMKRGTQVTPQPFIDYKVETSESFSKKSGLLDVNASLRLSILCGLIAGEGSAKYLEKKTSSTRECRVTLKCHMTTEVRELMINDLAAPNPEVLHKTDATHVVSQVLYGADALMEFQATASDASKKQVIEGDLNVMINKIQGVEIDGDGSLKMNDEDKEMVKSMSCKFYGDFHPKGLASTYKEAVKVYKELPSLLGEKGEKAVPVKVWLYPLSELGNTESKLKKIISDHLVSEVEEVMDDFHQAEIRTNDLLERSGQIKAEDIVHKLEQFQSSLSESATQFLRKMGELIPAIRGGEKEEAALRDLLKSLDASGFSEKEMKQWLDGKETEINLVTMYIKELACEIKPPGPELHAFLMDPNVTDAFVFSFTSLTYEEPYLNKISQAAENFKSGSTTCSTPELDPREEEDVPWTRRPGVKEALHSARDVFNQAALKNKVISFISDPNYLGASVQWYHNGNVKDPHVTAIPGDLCCHVCVACADSNSVDGPEVMSRAHLTGRFGKPAPDACKLTLDPNTAHRCLLLHEGNRKVTRVNKEQPYPDHPDRFDGHQVLSREPLTGRCYWECEWDGKMADIGVAYKSISRKGLNQKELDGLWIGTSDKAWCLKCTSESYSVWHNKSKTVIPAQGSRRVGVHVDREAGTVSFYSVSSASHALLHTFSITPSNEALYAAFWVDTDTTVSLV
ncbi:stonustoxin subunit beta-like [Alosa pseudoharengus]|uniref:stonustoxin subunit beta-like n=1 Tax=Alosa pseudoharengus TaxID=34774 RepID=UPI003F8A589A